MRHNTVFNQLIKTLQKKVLGLQTSASWMILLIKIIQHDIEFQWNQHCECYSLQENWFLLSDSTKRAYE